MSNDDPNRPFGGGAPPRADALATVPRPGSPAAPSPPGQPHAPQPPAPYGQAQPPAPYGQAQPPAAYDHAYPPAPYGQAHPPAHHAEGQPPAYPPQPYGPPGYPQAPPGYPQPLQGYAPQGHAAQAYAPQGHAPPGHAPQGYAPPGAAPAYYPQGAPAGMAVYGAPAPINIVVQNTTAGAAPAGALVRVANRNRMVAALLALFLGAFGAHKFYLGRTLGGVLYLVFFWTFLPSVAAFIEFIILLAMSDHDFDLKFNTALTR